MSERVRPHILKEEAICDDGCGLIAHDRALDNADLFIEACGFGIPISCLVRCKEYNSKIGGASDSEHLPPEEFDPEDERIWAGDFGQTNPELRMVMIEKTMAMRELGLVNHIEVADRHVHIGWVPEAHRFYGFFHWGKSK